VKPLHPLSPHGAARDAARFVDGLRAWWWPGAPASAALEAEERKAVHRWEDEGGNLK
jgi:hypothetical protein